MTAPVVLTVAGTDSGGAAGIAADLATFAALGAHGACVVTAVTAQDTTGVRDVHPIPVDSVGSQLDAVFDDLPVAAVKAGMLGSPEAVVCLRTRLGTLPHPRPPLVIDPVLVATSGAVLGDERVVDAYLDHLIPIATVVTPNLDEARALTGVDGPPDELAARLAKLGAAVVLTGGPDAVVPRLGRGRPRTSTTEDTTDCTDWVAEPGRDPVPLTHPAVDTSNDHGTGCTFSSALAVHLAHGVPLLAAARRAAAYTTHQLRASRHWTLGRGRGPIAHVSTTDEGER